MRTVLLCTSLVFLFANPASAQFAKGGPTARGEKKAADANAPKAGDKNAGPADNTAAPPAGAAANKLFAALDLDGDGIISKAELRKAIVSLKKLDTDNDGQLTMAECGIATDANGQPVADANAAGNPNAAGNDPNQNAAGAGVNGAGNTAFNGRGNDAMGLFFQLDTNHDGRLTRDEVPPQMMGALAHADLNGDGAIDAAEFAAAAKKMGDRMKAGYAAGLNGTNAGASNNGRRP
jgi:Ca2+-binding EF-hand superfamily protein